MKSIKTITFIVVLFLLSACEDERLSTVITTETRELSDFSKIHLDGVGDVEYIVSSEKKIEITTHVDLLHDVSTFVKNDELHIDLRKNNNKIKTLEYKVYAPEIVEFKINGVGDMESYDPIEVDHLTLLQDGVGKIRLNNILAESIFARLSDVGDIIIAGHANEVSYRLDGVGSIRAIDLVANIGDADLEGVGDIELYVLEDLTIHHDGMGKVYYKGNPTLHLSGDGGNIVGVN